MSIIVDDSMVETDESSENNEKIVNFQIVKDSLNPFKGIK